MLFLQFAKINRLEPNFILLTLKIMTYECKFGELFGGMGFTENCTNVGRLMVSTDTLTLLHHILTFP